MNTYLENELIYASRYGSLEIVKYLFSISSKKSVEYALFEAILHGNIDIVKFFISNGVNFHNNEEICLWTAAKQGHVDIVNYLVCKGADIHVLNESVLRGAARYKQSEVTKYLIEKGANIKVAIDNCNDYTAASFLKEILPKEEYKESINEETEWVSV